MSFLKQISFVASLRNMAIVRGSGLLVKMVGSSILDCIQYQKYDHCVLEIPSNFVCSKSFWVHFTKYDHCELVASVSFKEGS